MPRMIDIFNMVDMGGIDVVKAQGEQVDGLFLRLLNSIQRCRYSVLCNWLFAEIPIVPTYVELIFDGEQVIINDLITVTPDDVVHVHSLEIPIEPVIQPLSVTENGVFTPPSGVDGFSPVNVNVPQPLPVIQSLTVSENGTYYVPTGTDGFNPVLVSVSGNDFFPSYDTGQFVSLIASKYAGGYEYKSYIYGSEMLDTVNAVLLADASQGADSVELAESLSNFNGIILQGVYNKQRNSSYNTTIMYLSPALSTQYWAGMKDRNTAYDCFVTFSDNTTAVLSGNKQVIIYGIP